MDFPILNLVRDPHTRIFLVGATLVFLISIVFAITLWRAEKDKEEQGTFISFLRFFYASFLKPHTGDGTGNGQQDALESFYKAQAGVYDATRKRLLRGREDMLELVAAQLVNKAANERTHETKRIWVDVRFEQCYHVCFVLTFCLQDRRRYWLEYRGYVCICVSSRLLLKYLSCRLFPISLRGSSEAVHSVGLEERDSGMPGCEDFSS
jgi:hypothetical protein